jgi:hypothetical protein
VKKRIRKSEEKEVWCGGWGGEEGMEAEELR